MHFAVKQTSSNTSLQSSNWNQSFKIANNTSVDWNGLVDNVFEEEISNFARDLHSKNLGHSNRIK